jgi:SAM-dependent methyltransferase
MLDVGLDVLDAGTGSGYGAYLLASRFGDRVLSADVDPYLVETAGRRCREAGHSVRMETVDVTGDLVTEFDRIVATFSVPHIPASWVKALRPGGRVVTTLSDTTLILILDKRDDGQLRGVTAWDRAGFMAVRHNTRSSADDDLGRELAITGVGETHRSSFPVVDVPNAWPLWSTFNLENPGVRHEYIGGERRRALMWTDDGSWARADDLGERGALVTQGGTRRLWDALDAIRRRWLRDGDLPCFGARVKVDPDGTTTLWRGRGKWAWKVVRRP